MKVLLPRLAGVLVVAMLSVYISSPTAQAKTITINNEQMQEQKDAVVSKMIETIQEQVKLLQMLLVQKLQKEVEMLQAQAEAQY